MPYTKPYGSATPIDNITIGYIYLALNPKEELDATDQIYFEELIIVGGLRRTSVAQCSEDEFVHRALLIKELLQPLHPYHELGLYWADNMYDVDDDAETVRNHEIIFT
jgi:hypothetical protein